MGHTLQRFRESSLWRSLGDISLLGWVLNVIWTVITGLASLTSTNLGGAMIVALVAFVAGLWAMDWLKEKFPWLARGTATLPHVFVDGARSEPTGQGWVVYVGVANDDDKRALGVSLTITTENTKTRTTHQYQGPATLDVPPHDKREIALPVSVAGLDDMEVRGVITYMGHTSSYCFKYNPWPHGERPASVAQFVRCDAETKRSLGVHLTDGVKASDSVGGVLRGGAAGTPRTPMLGSQQVMVGAHFDGEVSRHRGADERSIYASGVEAEWHDGVVLSLTVLVVSEFATRAKGVRVSLAADNSNGSLVEEDAAIDVLPNVEAHAVFEHLGITPKNLVVRGFVEYGGAQEPFSYELGPHEDDSGHQRFTPTEPPRPPRRYTLQVDSAKHGHTVGDVTLSTSSEPETEEHPHPESEDGGP